MSGFRLSGHARSAAAPVRFRFDGRDLEGREGDTLAAALIGAGVTLVGRSFKYHRPRGVVGHGFAETNALVQLGAGETLVPNASATRVPLAPGLEARSVSAWPSLRFDIGAINGRLSKLLSAGFYYKTFMWPNWHLFEGVIRRAAGLGHAPTLADPDRYAARSEACDVLVVGGGVAGLAAALAAGRAGTRTMLVEADDLLGGGSPGKGDIEGKAPADWIAEAIVALAAMPHVRILLRTTVSGYYDGNFLTAVEEGGDTGPRQRFWKIRAGRVVLATGAFERPMLFGANDVPGVMLADSMRHYLERHGVAAGRRPFFAIADDHGWQAVLAARQAGLDVAGVVDLRADPGDAAEEAAAFGVPIFAGHRIVRAIGRHAVRAVEIADPAGRKRRISCDMIAMSGGWSPAVQLFTQAGGLTRFDPTIGAAVPDRAAQPGRSCGAARGVFDLALCVADGEAAGRWAATGEEIAVVGPEARQAVPLTLPAPGAKAFVDFQTDVTVDDLALATRENYRSIEHVKRYTVWGMGTDQGRLSASNGIEVLGALQQRAVAELGGTRFRPPFAPVAFGALTADRPVGRLFRPWKRLPAHDWHVAAGARFEDHGWFRPSDYPLPGESLEDAARREALAVRNGVGLIDSSSFGKIEIKGPDAGRFLDLMSVGSPSTMGIGQIRYNLMCTELGDLLDDGVIARLADDHFLMTASSGHADRVFRWLDEWHQCEWPLDLVLQDATAAWAVLTLAGPRARAVLERADCDIGLSRESFPHNHIRCGRIAGVETRIQRVSFTGELSYEIAVPADYAEALADHLMACGAQEGIVPFGLEALDLLRLEKGFIHVGSDTDSRTLPMDIGWGKGIARKASDFVGKRSLLHAASQAPGRAKLVGLQPVDPTVVLPIGGHILAEGEKDGGGAKRVRGFVTSSGMSPMLERGLSLALLEEGARLHGSEVVIWSEGRTWPARVTPPASFDPKGARLDA